MKVHSKKLPSSYLCYSFRFFPANNFKYSGSLTMSSIVFIMALAIKIAIRIAAEGECNP